MTTTLTTTTPAVPPPASNSRAPYLNAIRRELEEYTATKERNGGEVIGRMDWTLLGMLVAGLVLSVAAFIVTLIAYLYDEPLGAPTTIDAVGKNVTFDNVAVGQSVQGRLLTSTNSNLSLTSQPMDVTDATLSVTNSPPMTSYPLNWGSWKLVSGSSSPYTLVPYDGVSTLPFSSGYFKAPKGRHRFNLSTILQSGLNLTGISLKIAYITEDALSFGSTGASDIIQYGLANSNTPLPSQLVSEFILHAPGRIQPTVTILSQQPSVSFTITCELQALSLPYNKEVQKQKAEL